MTTWNGSNGGRTTAAIAASIKGNITSGALPVGALLPSVRQLSEEHGVSTKTAHRALKSLADEGLIASEPSRGYRVLPKANSPADNCPMAYVLDSGFAPEKWNELHKLILASLQAACHAKGWSLLTIGSQDRTPTDIVDQLKVTRAFGAALDLLQPDMVAAIRDAGIPAVMVDCALEDVDADVLIQDGQHGAAMAVDHLAAQGCKKIAWIGHTSRTAHSQERFSGALLGMQRAGFGAFDPDMILDLAGRFTPRDTSTVFSDPGIEAVVRQLLSTGNRPDGILTMWMDLAHLVTRVAADLGIQLGTDYHLVGWSMEELYESTYGPGFMASPVPPAITWSSQTMAETAVARLAERRENPKLAPLRIKIPTRLQKYQPTTETSK